MLLVFVEAYAVGLTSIVSACHFNLFPKQLPLSNRERRTTSNGVYGKRKFAYT